MVEAEDVPEVAREVLRSARTVAVLGMKNPEFPEPASSVPRYLARHGFRVVPVNPELAAAGVPDAVARLGDLAETPDVVQVFRSPLNVEEHEAELLALRPPVVWFQPGTRNEKVAKHLEREGITVVRDRCMFQDHDALVRGGVLAGDPLPDGRPVPQDPAA